MAVFADVVEEWKKASPKEKLLIAGGGAAVIALALYLHSKSSSQSSLAGTGTTGVGGSFQPATGGTGTGTGTGTTGAPPNDGGTGLPPPTFLGPPQGRQGTVRAAGQFPGWDAQHTGVPLRSSPGGAITGYAPWNSVLDLLGSMSGPSNQSGDPSAAGQGSTTWYQTASGWISAADLNLSPVAVNGTVNNAARPQLRRQPNTTTSVYANTRHSPSAQPIRTVQSAPPQQRPR